MTDIDYVLYVCGHCGTRSRLPKGPLPKGWQGASTPMPEHLRESPKEAMPKHVCVAMCSKACDNANTKNIQSITINRKVYRHKKR